jgi:hypothetical protein
MAKKAKKAKKARSRSSGQATKNHGSSTRVYAKKCSCKGKHVQDVTTHKRCPIGMSPQMGLCLAKKRISVSEYKRCKPVPHQPRCGSPR